MSEHSQTRWYVLQVHPNHEVAAASRLRTYGIESFLPRCSVPGRGPSSAVTPQVLFPGYLFCLLQIPTTPKLYHIPGVIRLLGPPRRPTPIDDEEIRQLKLLVDADIAAEVHSQQQERRGMYDAPITAGPLAGLKVSVLQLDQKCEVLITFPTIGCSVAVTVPYEWLKPTRSVAANGSPAH